MKNIQVIDGALNCTFSIFESDDADFRAIFPKKNQNIQFNDELGETQEVTDALERLWENPILKEAAIGIHGTLIYDDFDDQKKEHFPSSRRFCDIDERYVNEHEREILRAQKMQLDGE